MRNLKRVLSLALALVMVLGMMVITTSAADFTDADEITYKEAVEVMTEIGILKGMGDGTFAPKATLTRAQAAKIIAFVCLGAEADDYLTGSAAAFEDVAADDWAAKYVAFCKNAKIVDGNGDGTFNPNGTLTTVQFAKMLLGALGIEGSFTGAGWDANVKNAAEKADLDVVAIDYTEITREEACAMALAAMDYSATPDIYQVLYTNDTKAHSTKIGEFEDLMEAELYASILGRYEETTTGEGEEAVTTGEGYYVQQAPVTDSLLSKIYGVICDDTTAEDAFGRPGVRYYDALTEGDELNLFYADEPIATYTAPVEADDMAKAYGKYEFAAGLAASDIASAADYGVVVEVYGSVAAKKVTDIVVIEELLGKVTKVTEAKGEAKRTVIVAGMPFETEEFAKGDTVLYTVAGGEIQSMVAPETVTGKIESYNAKTVTVDGEAYNYGKGFTLTADWTNEQVFTLYSDGSIAAQADKAEAAVAAPTDYAYVVKAQYQAWSDGTSDLLGTTGAKDAAAKAQVIFADGTVAVIDLTMTNTQTNPVLDPVYVVDAPKNDGTVTEDASVGTGTNTINEWFAYTVAEDGTYTLSAIDSAYAVVDRDGVTLTKDVMVKLGTKYTTADTTITTVDTEGTVTTKTGFVAATLTGEVLVTYAKGSNVVAALYAVGQTPAEADPDTTVYYAVKSGNVVKGGTEWTFAAKGEQVTVVIYSGTVNAGGFYTLTAGTDANAGMYAASGASVTNTALVTLISGDQVAFSDGSIKVLTDKTNVYNIDDTAEVVGEVKALEVGDIILYTEGTGANAGKLVNVWVYGVDATVEAKTTTLAATLATAPAGTTIVLADGTYSTITLNGSQAANLTIEGNGANTVVAGITSTAAVNGLTLKNIKFTAGATNTGGSPVAVALEGAVTSVTVSGCQFVGSGEDDNSIAILLGANSGKIVITDNVIDGFDYPMQLTPSAATEITGNIIKNTHDRAIRFLQVAANVTVTIKDNAMTDAKDTDGQVFKVGYTGYNAVASGAKITFDGNTYDGAAWDPADITTASADAIAYKVDGTKA